MTLDALTCQELVELVTAYLDEALSAADRVRFEEHLDICEGCRRYLKQIKMTKMLVGQLREEHITGSSREELLHAFSTWKSSQPPRTTH